MKEQLEALFENWINPKKRDESLLTALYSKVFSKPLDKCPKCRSKAIQELRKFYELTFEEVKPTTRQYVLLPGDHYFIKGDTAHNNENTSDQVLAWYLQNFPHIKPLFIKTP